MDKMTPLFVLVAALALADFCLADLYFKRLPTSQKSVENFDFDSKGIRKFKCVPGRTVVKYTEHSKMDAIGEDYSDDEEYRRHHMNNINVGPKDESCKICVCSAEGYDEYCSRRPADNINECIKMQKLMGEIQSNMPFSHERDLSQMIRRDWIWHRDDIPYDPKAKCYRGTSYYTNNPKANDTTIADIESDLESMLSYDSKSVCFACVCNVKGDGADCMSRDTYYCDYYRVLGRDSEASRDMYNFELGEDKPTYFRTLSYRLRRTFDDGVYDMIETAGTKISAGGECIPYVSQYSDCSEDNQCTGCTKCSCSSEGRWACRKIRDCPKEMEAIADNSIEQALDDILYEFRDQDKGQSEDRTSSPVKKETFLDNKDELEFEEKLQSLLRDKRSLKSKKSKKSGKELKDNDKSTVVNQTDSINNTGSNGTITFYNTVDELNEDTLKNSNISGTLQAQKVDIKLSTLKTNKFAKGNNTFDNSLQIYNLPENYHQNIDNKIDSNHSDYDLKEQANLGIVTNHTQREKNEELSKIIVNELKPGSEIIGDKSAPVASNITFTPENDTLTAIAYIAGNLLNKVWNMEKASEESLEIDAMKNEKLQDLLELFKEPLTIRQENFLKTALQSLSTAIDKHKEGKNISICESLGEAQQFLEDAENGSWEKSKVNKPGTKVFETKFCKNNTLKDTPLPNSKNATAKAVSKITDVLELIKKYHSTQEKLNDLNNKNTNALRSKSHSGEDIIGNETDSMDVFGNILEKITKLLLPYKSSKKQIRRIKNTNKFVKNEDLIKKRIKNKFNIDIPNSNLTIKDKIILDYITKIKQNPSLLLEDDSEESPSINFDKDIMLNLSEFLKIKSFVDLVNLLDSNNKTKNKNNLVFRTQDEPPSDSPTTEVINKIDSSTNKPLNKPGIDRKDSSKKIENPCNGLEKFKEHVKIVLEDLNDLKKEVGQPCKLELANIFPCIHNFIMSSNVLNNSNNKSVDPYKKLSDVIKEIKTEYNNTSTAITRRMGNNEITQILKQTPKSALVWERVVANLEKKRKQNARRNIEFKAPISLEKLLEKLQKMQKISSSRNTYKVLIKKITEPAEQLMILKAIHAENQRNLDNLNDIKASLDTILNSPSIQQQEINRYLYESAKKIKFHNLLLERKDKYKNSRQSLIMDTEQQTELAVGRMTDEKANRAINLELQSAKLILQPKESKNEDSKLESRNNTKIELTREEILSQLIKNRVNKYLKTKDGNKNNATYSIAKSILLNLESGNIRPAKQLYKIFVTTQMKSSDNSVKDKSLAENINEKLFDKKLKPDNILEPVTPAVPDSPVPNIPDLLGQLRRNAIIDKEPLINFEDPTRYIRNKLLSARRDMMLKKMLASNDLKLL